MAPWTDHEKKVCSRESLAISSLVMEPGAVVMLIDHLGMGAAPPRTSSNIRRTTTGWRRLLVRHYSTPDGHVAASLPCLIDLLEATQDGVGRQLDVVGGRL